MGRQTASGPPGLRVERRFRRHVPRAHSDRRSGVAARPARPAICCGTSDARACDPRLARRRRDPGQRDASVL